MKGYSLTVLGTMKANIQYFVQNISKQHTHILVEMVKIDLK